MTALYTAAREVANLLRSDDPLSVQEGALERLEAALGALPQGEAVAWRSRQLHHEVDAPITGWQYGDFRPDHTRCRNRFEVQPLYLRTSEGE